MFFASVFQKNFIFLKFSGKIKNFVVKFDIEEVIPLDITRCSLLIKDRLFSTSFSQPTWKSLQKPSSPKYLHLSLEELVKKKTFLGQNILKFWGDKNFSWPYSKSARKTKSKCAGFISEALDRSKNTSDNVIYWYLNQDCHNQNFFEITQIKKTIQRACAPKLMALSLCGCRVKLSL